MNEGSEKLFCEIDDKDILIGELKEIVQQYEYRLNSKDKNFQLQFSELQNELIARELDIEKIIEEKNKLECQLYDAGELLKENGLVLKSKDTALQIIQEDLKIQLEDIKSHYNETLMIRQEEIESLRLTGSQLREQLTFRENDLIELMQRHENQINDLFNELKKKNEQPNIDNMVTAMQDQITTLRSVLLEKQDMLRAANQSLSEQDVLIRQLQEKNLNLEEEIKKKEHQKFSDQTYQKHIDQLNENIKESNKRQLKLKARIKSLEKQLESSGFNITKEDDKEKNFKNELEIRDKIIDKQNILIEELRQTEESLRLNLNRSIATQEEQILELKYWEIFSELNPDCGKIYSNKPVSTEPLKMAIEHLELIYVSKSNVKKQDIRNIIKNLNSCLDFWKDRSRYSIELEEKLELLNSCLINTNKLNINLNKHIGTLIKDYKTVYKALADIDNDMQNPQIEDLHLCSSTELIQKIFLQANQSYSFNEKIFRLENDVLRLNLEMNKIAEICVEMCFKIEASFQEIETFLSTQVNIRKDYPIDVALVKDVASVNIKNIFTNIFKRQSWLKLQIESYATEINEKNKKISECFVNQIKDLDYQMTMSIQLEDDKMVKDTDNIIRELDIKKNEVVVLQKEKNESQEIMEIKAKNGRFEENLQNASTNVSELAELLSLQEARKNESEDQITEIKLKDELEIIQRERDQMEKELNSFQNKILLLEKKDDQSSIRINQLERENSQLNQDLEIVRKNDDEKRNELFHAKEQNTINFGESEFLKDSILILKKELGENVLKEIKLKDELESTRKDKNSFKKDTEELRNKFILYETAQGNMQNVIDKLNIENESLENDLERRKSNEIRLIKELEYLSKKDINTVKEYEKLKNEISIIQKEKHEIEIRVENLNKELMVVEANLNQVQSNEIKLRDTIGEIMKEKENILNELESLRNKCSVLEKGNEEIQTTLEISNTDNLCLKKDIESIQKKEKQLEDELLNSNEEKKIILKELEMTKARIPKFEMEVKQMKTDETNLQEELLNLRKEKVSMTKQLEEITNKILIYDGEREESTLQMIQLDAENLKLKEDLKIIANTELQLKDEFLCLEEEKEVLITETNTVKESVLKMSTDMQESESKLKIEVITIKESRDILISELTKMKQKILILQQENQENHSIMETITSENLQFREDLIAMDANKIKLNQDLTILLANNETILEELEIITKRMLTIENKIEDKSVKELLQENELEKDSITLQLNDQMEKSLLEKDRVEINIKIEQMNEKMMNLRQEINVKIENEVNLNQENLRLKDAKTFTLNELKISEEKFILLEENFEEIKKRVKDFESQNLILEIKNKDNESVMENLEINGSECQNELHNKLQTNEEKEIMIRELKYMKDSILKLEQDLEETVLKETQFKNDLEKVSKDRNNIKKELKRMVSTNEECKKINETLNIQKNRFEEVMALRYIKETELMNEVQALTEMKENTVKANEKLKSEMTLIKREKDESEIRVETLNKELKVLKEIIESRKNEEITFNSKHVEILKERDEIKNELKEVKNELKIFEQERKDIISLFHSMDREMTELDIEISSVDNKIVEGLLKTENENEDVGIIMKKVDTLKNRLKLYDQYKDEKNILQKQVEDLLSNQKQMEDKLNCQNDERDGLINELKSLKNSLFLFQNEKKDDYSLLEELRNQLSLLKSEIRKMNTKEIELSNQVSMMKAENSFLIEETEKLKNQVILLENEKVVEQMIINNLKEKNIMLIKEAEDSEMWTVKFKDDFKHMEEEKEIIERDLETFQRKVSMYEIENVDNNSLIIDINYQLEMHKQMLRELSANESESKNILKYLTNEKDDALRELQDLKLCLTGITKNKEKIEKKTYSQAEKITMKNVLEETKLTEETLVKNILDIKKETMYLLKDFEEARSEIMHLNKSIGEIQQDKFERESIINELKNVNKDLLGKYNEKLKEIQELDKNNLIMKARLIKIKKQSDQKIMTLTKEKEELSQRFETQKLLIEKEYLLKDSVLSLPQLPISSSKQNNFANSCDFSCQCAIDEIVAPNEEGVIPIIHKASSLLSSNFNQDSFNEKSLFNQIASMSDEVDAKVRKVNFELEEFLERNERVTSSLVSKTSPHHSNSCIDLQCQKIYAKNRELSMSIKNLQEQNQIMKNQVIDLHGSLEREQEDKFHLNENLTQKLNDFTDENAQLHLQITHLKEGIKSLKKEKEKYLEKLTNTETEFSEISVKYSSILIEKNDLSELYQKFCSQFEENKNLLAMLEKNKTELMKINQVLTTECMELERSKQIVIDLCEEKCRNLKSKNETSLIEISKLSIAYNEKMKVISLLENEVARLKKYNENVELLETSTNRNLVDLISFLVRDVTELSSNLEELESSKERYRSILETNKIIKNQIGSISDRFEWIENILKEKILNNSCQSTLNSKEMQLVNEFDPSLKTGLIDSINDDEDNLSISDIIIPKQSYLQTEVIKSSIQEEIINKLNSNFHFKYKRKGQENFCDIFDIYLQEIKTLLNQPYPIKEMVNVETQKYLDSDIYNDELEMLKNNVCKLEHDLEFEKSKNSDLSDKFEQIIIGLESACDAEVEKLKLSNDTLKQEVISLKINCQEKEDNMNALRKQLFHLQINCNKDRVFKEEKSLVVGIETSDNSLNWMSNLNDALKQTISEKEDQITELMKCLNELSIENKALHQNKEFHFSETEQLKTTLNLISNELKNKAKIIDENLDVINEFEVILVEKDNRINSLEKELAEINNQLEQYISAVCSMQARLEASKPNIESMLSKRDNMSNNLQLLNLIDQLEKDYAEELEQSEASKSKLEMKLNKAVQAIHKLKKQLKQSHSHVLKLHEEFKLSEPKDQIPKINTGVDTVIHNIGSVLVDVSTQIDFVAEDVNYKGIIENLQVNNFLLWKELDTIHKSDRNNRGSSLPAMGTGSIVTNKTLSVDSERSLSPVSQISSNSIEGGDYVNSNKVKDLQRKIQRTTQQLNQMRVERNRIHQEYTKIRQLKEEGDQKISDLIRQIDANRNQENILHEKDQLLEINNKYSTKIVELQAEIDMTSVRNSILETKCKKMEWKLNNQRRKYDQMVLKLDEKEQEIDRCSDEIIRNNSTFEKERLDWLREKKELKISNKNKDEKISEFRKRLTAKSKDKDGKNDKNETFDSNTENDYSLEIEQLRKQLNQQKLENKQCLVKHKEEMNKQKGRLEELIDDNRQLKRKLALDQQVCKMNFTDSFPIKSGSSLMHKIDEVSETSSFTYRNSSNSSVMLAKVVLEKESLLQLLSDKEDELINEKQKSEQYQQEIYRMGRSDREQKMINSIQQQKIDKWIQTTDLIVESNSKSEKISNQHIQINDHYECFYPGGLIRNRCFETYTQTDDDFELFVLEKYKNQMDNNNDKFSQIKCNDYNDNIVDYKATCLSKLNIHKIVEIDCITPLFNIDIDTQTDPIKFEYPLNSFELTSQSISVQTDNDKLTETLYQENQIKDDKIISFSHKIRLQNSKLYLLEEKLKEADSKIALIESKNLDYQKIIGSLKMEKVENEKKYNHHIEELRLEIEHFKETSKNESTEVKSNEKDIDQTLDVQLTEGWDMEWEYEKINHESQTIKSYLESKLKTSSTSCADQPENDLYSFLVELDLLLNVYSDEILFKEIRKLMSIYNFHYNSDSLMKQHMSNNSNIISLVGILRDEITQLKQTIVEKNQEIGQLKCLRNQLQANLMESGQQIKDSNMEFLNLKENIQAVNNEKDILEQKSREIEEQLKKLVQFIQLLSFDLRRLRDSTLVCNESTMVSSVMDEKNIKAVTQSIEYELHKLLEQMYEKDVKLEKSINQGLNGFDQSGSIHDSTDRIEKMSSAIHQLQFQQKDPIKSMNGKPNSESQKSDNDIPFASVDHEECQNYLMGLSELLDKKQVEIEELKSRLFLATDQLIHFRTFFTDPDYKLNQEYLPVIDQRKSSFEYPIQESRKHHTRLLVESDVDDQFSNGDQQSIISPDGNTVIRVDRIAGAQKPHHNKFLSSVFGRLQCRNIFDNVKCALSSSNLNLLSFRSQPRLNIKTLFSIYMVIMHLLLLRCILL